MKTSKRRRPLHGLYPQNFPRPSRWKVSVDYLDQLSEEELEWLSDFNDCEYRCDFRNSVGEQYDDDSKHFVRSVDRAAMEDAYGRSAVPTDQGIPSHRLLSLTDPDVQISEHPPADERTPEYLDSPEYKQAREAFRATLSKRRVSGFPKITKKHLKTKAKLEALVREAQAEDPNAGYQEPARRRRKPGARHSPSDAPDDDS